MAHEFAHRDSGLMFATPSGLRRLSLTLTQPLGGLKHFFDDLSNSGPAVRLYGEGGATGPPKDLGLKTVTGEKVMPQYLVANYPPDDFDPSAVTEATTTSP